MLPLDEARCEYERLQALNKPFFVPKDIARILGVGSYTINCVAHDNPANLGFPVIVAERRIRIPRAAFLDYVSNTVLGIGAA